MVKSSVLLKEERASKIQAQKELLDARKASGADFNDEQRAQFNTLQKDIEALDAQIEQREMEEKAEQRAAAAAAPVVHSVQGKVPESTVKDLRSYSMLKAVRSQMGGKLDGIEAEMHQEAVKEARDAGTQISGVGVPNVAAGVLFAPEKRAAMTTDSDAAGGYLVPEDPHELVTALREGMVTAAAGAQMWGGLTGNVPVDGLTGVSVTWPGEDANASESNPTASQKVLKPNRVTGYSTFSKQLLMQTSGSVDRALRADYAAALQEAWDAVAINGGGSNEPTGILATSGIGDVEGGTNGLAPAFSHMLELEETVGNAKGLRPGAQLAVVSNHKVRRVLKGTKIDAGSGFMVWQNNEVNGYTAYASNAVPSDLDKGTATGVCSAIVFGNFRDLVLAQWGGVDLLVDPYSAGIAGNVRLIAALYVDVAVLRAASFAAMKDALTA